MCNELGVEFPPPTPSGVPAIESGSSLNEGTCECGDGLAADGSADGGVPTELVALGLAAFVATAVLLGLMVGEDVDDNGPPVIGAGLLVD